MDKKERHRQRERNRAKLHAEQAAKKKPKKTFVFVPTGDVGWNDRVSQSSRRIKRVADKLRALRIPVVPQRVVIGLVDIPVADGPSGVLADQTIPGSTDSK